MVTLYYMRINRGLMTIDDVPEHWKIEVQKLLDADKIQEPKE